MLSRSGDTRRPRTSTSSPTFPTIDTSSGSTTPISPRRKRAPPTPPERTATFTSGRLAAELVQHRARPRAEPVGDAVQVVEGVDVVGEVRDVDEPRRREHRVP